MQMMERVVIYILQEYNNKHLSSALAAPSRALPKSWKTRLIKEPLHTIITRHTLTHPPSASRPAHAPPSLSRALSRRIPMLACSSASSFSSAVIFTSFVPASGNWTGAEGISFAHASNPSSSARGSSSSISSGLKPRRGALPRRRPSGIERGAEDDAAQPKEQLFEHLALGTGSAAPKSASWIPPKSSSMSDFFFPPRRGAGSDATLSKEQLAAMEQRTVLLSLTRDVIPGRAPPH